MSTESKEIVERVRDLYMRYGIKSITMDDVASQLGMSKKTLYQFVSNKEELVGKVIDLEIELLNKGMECPERDNVNAIEELLFVGKVINKKMKELNYSTLFDLKKYYPHHYERLTNARREKMHINVIRNIEKGQHEGLYRKDLDSNIIARIQISRVEGIVDNDILSVEEFTSERFFTEIFVYHIRGIANQTGIEFLDNKMKDFDINDFNSLFKQ